MPNRQIVGGEQYRYAFQGQEKDAETGMEAFQLRLWDGRIGRWLSPDPYGQYHSPYLGMGNNPINGVDVDGGFFLPGAIIGAVINAGLNIYSQGGFSGKKIDWTRVGVAGAGGFVAGGTGLLSVAVATNVVGDVADQYLSNGGDFSKVDLKQSAFAGFTTFVGGKIGNKIANNKFINRQVSKLHEKIFGRKYYSGGSINNPRSLEGVSQKYSSEVIGGLIIGGLTNQYQKGKKFSDKIFKTPDFNEFDSSFLDFQNNNLFFQNIFNNRKTSSIEVGNLQIIGIEE